MLPPWWTPISTRPYAIADCIEGMKKMPDKCIDLILTDPPYGIGYCSGGNSENTKIVNDEEFNEDFNNKWVSECTRLLKDNSAAFIFTSYAVIHKWIPLIEKYLRIKNIIVWVKNNWTKGDLEGNYGNQYELIIYAVKGKPKIRGFRWANVWNFDREPPKGHPTIKNDKLFVRIIDSLTDKDAIVFDPFLGSGTTLLACRKIDRIGLGFEIEPKYEPLIKNRSRAYYCKIESWSEDEDVIT